MSGYFLFFLCSLLSFLLLKNAGYQEVRKGDDNRHKDVDVISTSVYPSFS